MNDEELVTLFLARDEKAIAETSQSYGRRLRALAQGIVADCQTAEECENSAYWEAWQSIPPHEPRTYLYAFLARIVRHLALNCCRERNRLKRKGHICQLTEEMEQCIPSPDDCQCRLEEQLFQEVINRFLTALPKEKRQIFLRRYWYLESIQTIAQGLGLGESKVKTTLLRCRKQLREFLEREGYEL